ncbi:NfeD family protein [Clostridium sp. Ade.TY]|uniref:NfeD family protein n=1 Tax=Clostridium sp. Ade.TY TaxID=1391647 RepID=UPI000424C9D7|nr:NfeD family protein [Clostridium sp. Ade.TY]
MALTIFWIIIAVAMVGIDLATSAFLFSWIGLGAITAMFLNIFGISFLIQIIMFGVVSVIAIGIGYPWAKKKFKVSLTRTQTMEESYIGMKFEAEKNIAETAMIKVGGVYWSAINEGKEIKKGEKFIITGIEGNKFKIKGFKEEK